MIQTPTINDYDAINELARQVLAQHIEYRPDIYKMAEKPFRQDYYNSLIKNGRIFIFKQGDIIAGYTIIRIDEKDAPAIRCRKSLFIEDLAVRQGYQKQGIGTALMNHIKALAKRENCTLMELSVSPQNINAIKLYEKLGMAVKYVKYSTKVE